MKRRKKRKLKRNVIVVFGGVLVLAMFLCLCSFSFKKEIYEEEKVDYVNSILATTNVFSSDFLFWVSVTYGNDSLKIIDTSLKDNTYELRLWHEATGNSYLVLQDLFSNHYENADNVTIIEGDKEEVTISFAGDVSFADNWHIMPYYQKREQGILGIFSSSILSYMEKTDWMIVNNEFAFSDRGSPMPKKVYTFRANPQHVTLYKDMNVDMVTLANNHVYDFGTDSFLDTLDTLKQANVPYIGAGRNLEEATKPYYLVIGGYKIAFLNATRAEKYILTPGATETSDGVFRCYDPTLLASRIAEEKRNSDYVVALVHYGTEDSHGLEEVQIESSKLYIDSGADLVVGSHAHVLQGAEFYKGKLIAYNLGNFLFNDSAIDTGILTWHLKKDGQSEFSFLPALQKDCYTDILTGEDAIRLFQNMTEWSVNAMFLESGTIVEK